MKKIVTLLFSLLVLQSFSQCTDLFFSEYIEGSSNNKALELYNPTPAPVDLSNYTIKTYFNGSSTTTTSTTLSGTLNPGDVYVIAHSSANAAILAQADLTLGGNIVNFNGDDVIELYNVSTLIDVFGTLGTDPGASWTVSGDAAGSVNHTLRRLPSVQSGEITWAGTGENQWTVYPQDATWYLGTHVMNTCGSSLSGSGSGTGVCLGTASDFAVNGTAGTAPYLYGWDFGDGSTASVQNASYTFGSAGTYNITFYIYDAALNVYAETFAFTIYPVSDAVITAPPAYCSGDCTGDTLTATPAGGSWSGTGISDITEGVFSPCMAGTGTHTVYYTVSGPCGDTDSVSVSVTQQEDVNILTGDTTFCNDSFGIFLSADAGGTWSGQYVSDSGGGNGFFSSAVIPPGVYYAVYTIPGMCGDADSVALTIGQYPVASFTYTVSGNQVILTNTSTDAGYYSWEINEDGEITNSMLTDFTYNYTDPANDVTICLTATNGYGCSMITCETITGNSILETAFPEVKIYPNPTNGILVIDDLPAGDNIHLSIKDIAGRNVLSVSGIDSKTVIDLSAQSKGVYFLTLTSAKGSITRRISID